MTSLTVVIGRHGAPWVFEVRGVLEQTPNRAMTPGRVDMDHERENTQVVDELELDRRAWNLPPAREGPQAHTSPASVPSRREDETETESEAG